MTKSALSSALALDDLSALEKDEAWRRAAEEAEAAIPSHVLAGIAQPKGWMKTWPELPTYSHYMQIRSLVLYGFATILREVCSCDVYEAASNCGKPLVFERLFEPGDEVKIQLLALVKGEKLGPRVELTRERLAVVRAVLQQVLTAEDWKAIAQAAANQVQQQVMGLRIVSTSR